MTARHQAAMTALISVLSVVATLGGFGLWVLSEARAAAAEGLNHAKHVEKKVSENDAGMRGELRLLRSDMEARQRLTEEKVDRVEQKVDEVLKELRRRR